MSRSQDSEPIFNLVEVPLLGRRSPPKLYEQAKQALAECARIDECKTWADKAAALASYARQTNDQRLETYARRVRARAIRREGELLDEIEPEQGKRTDLGPKAGTNPKLMDDMVGYGFARTSARQAVADKAKLSAGDVKTALRVAHVPQAEFDAAVDGNKPASITALAERGTQTRPRRGRAAFRRSNPRR